MKGLDLAKGYYEEVVRPMLERDFPQLLPTIAAGLVGEGSECFGYDDDLSQDHDFGPDICLWLREDAFSQEGPALTQAYAALADSFRGYMRKPVGPEAAHRRGVMSVDSFYRRTLAGIQEPVTALDWFKIPQAALATATNGEVWTDPAGLFTARRELLMYQYPDDVRRKKSATRLAQMAQSGQYNYPRALRRQDMGSAYLALAEFVNHALAALFLLNDRYMPFYKWRFRAAQDLPRLHKVYEALSTIVRQGNSGADGTDTLLMVEAICQDIGQAVADRYELDQRDAFLIPLAEDLAASVSDPALKKLPLLFDIE